MTVENLGYCGARCMTCFAYKKNVSEAAKSLRRELRAEKMCRGGGGNPWCKIRQCARKREFAGCWECGEADACRKLLLAYRPNLDRIRRGGMKAFLAKE
jgi:hypothetical protein